MKNVIRNLLIILAAVAIVAGGCSGPQVGWRGVVFTTSSGATVQATLAGERPDRPLVLLLPDAGAPKEGLNRIAYLSALKGIATISFNLPPEGSSKLSAADCVDVVRAAVKFAQDNAGWDKKRLGIAGTCFGADVAIEYAAQEQGIAVIVLISPDSRYGREETSVTNGCQAENALVIATTGTGGAYPVFSALPVKDDHKEAVDLIGDASGMALLEKIGKRRPSPEKPYDGFKQNEADSPARKVEKYEEAMKEMEGFKDYNVTAELISWLEKNLK